MEVFRDEKDWLGKIKTRLDALLVIDEYLTDPSEDWLRLVIKTEEDYGSDILLTMALVIL